MVAKKKAVKKTAKKSAKPAPRDEYDPGSSKCQCCGACCR